MKKCALAVVLGVWSIAAAAQSPLPELPPDSVFRQDISSAPVHPDSDTILNWLAGAGGWGLGAMRIDFSIEVLHADQLTPRESFITTSDFYSPDCDHVPVPLPPGGALEGEVGYECVSDGDCHLIVVEDDTNQLFEMWRANIVGSDFLGGCLAVWELGFPYGPEGRGEQCTSADAAGFPIAPLLFGPDEVAAGSIDHAIRFILPNARMRAGVYVRPATHAGGPQGPTTAVPYGARLRLKASYDLNDIEDVNARVVAQAMKTYGIVLADGGVIALTAQSDRFTTASWAALGIDTHSLNDLEVTDFEIVDTGDLIPLTYDCVRLRPILLDGFELGALDRWTTP
jgi:hypothetical protein